MCKHFLDIVQVEPATESHVVRHRFVRPLPGRLLEFVQPESQRLVHNRFERDVQLAG